MVCNYKQPYLEDRQEDPHLFSFDCDQHSPKYQIKLLIGISLYVLSKEIIIPNVNITLKMLMLIWENARMIKKMFEVFCQCRDAYCIVSL